MKTTKMAVLTASVCVALSVSAFALPCFAKVGLDNIQGKVMEKETPKEYMEDFYASVQGADESLIFLTENQTQQLTTMAEQAYKGEFDIDIPEGLELSYTVNRYNPEADAVSIQLVWSGNTVDGQLIKYWANFNNRDFPDGYTNIELINAYNGFDVKRFEDFTGEGAEILKSELDLDIPDDYVVGINLSASFANGKWDKKLRMSWGAPELDATRSDGTPISSKAFYTVGYDKVDLSQGTGRVTEVQKFYEFTQQSIMQERAAPGYKEFTEIQQNDMLDAAKQFLAEKEIEIGNLRRSLQITIEEKPVMWFTFEAMGLNDSVSGSVTVTITPELKILGYTF